MQDDVNTNNTNGQSTEAATPPTISHVYYEVGTDVLSKPNALCDILEVNGCPPSAIFCNAPSDADLVDVILKKRGISALKLIGHVPPMRCSKALKQVKAGEVSCLVITDVSGQSIDVEELDLVINYSLPSAPEVYIHRCGHTRAGQKLSRVISLIGALDIANLHYLKKVVEFDIEKSELPSKDQISASALTKLRKQAIDTASMNDARITELTKQVLSDDNKSDLVALLLRNTLDILPSLQAGQSRSDTDEGMEMGEEREERWGRRDNDRGGRGRGGRYGNRGGRGGGYYDDHQRSGMSGDDGEQQGGDYNNHEDRRSFRSDRPMTPPEKNARIYIGQGTSHGLSSSKLEAVLAEHNVSLDKIKGSKIRNSYSFVDVPEEGSDDLVNALNAGDGNKRIFARKATTVSVPREAQPQSEQQTQDGDAQPVGNDF